jgi:hypothetical protein
VNLYIGNSNVVQLRGLRHAVTGQYFNAATASFSVLRNGAAVSGGSNISMSYVAGSNGNYFGVLPETAGLNNSVHVVVITVDGGVNADAVWTIPVRPKVRNS